MDPWLRSTLMLGVLCIGLVTLRALRKFSRIRDSTGEQVHDGPLPGDASVPPARGAADVQPLLANRTRFWGQVLVLVCVVIAFTIVLTRGTPLSLLHDLLP